MGRVRRDRVVSGPVRILGGDIQRGLRCPGDSARRAGIEDTVRSEAALAGSLTVNFKELVAALSIQAFRSTWKTELQILSRRHHLRHCCRGTDSVNWRGHYGADSG